MCSKRLPFAQIQIKEDKMTLKQSIIKRMPTYIDLKDWKPENNIIHESNFRGPAIKELMKDYLQAGVPAKIILDIIEDLEKEDE